MTIVDGICDVIRAKWIMDGAETLSEAADKLRSFADYLEELEKVGIQLIEKVEADYGFIDGPGVGHLDEDEEL